MKNFKKCDFHIHSKFSDGGIGINSEDEYIETLLSRISEEEIDYISITDHVIDGKIFNKDQYNKIKYKLNLIGKDVFPGAELNLYINDESLKKYGLKKGKKNSFHSILIFDPEKVDLFIEKFNEIQMSNKTRTAYELFEVFSLLNEIDFYFIVHSSKTNSIEDFLPNDNGGPNEKFKQKLTFFNISNYGLDGKRNNENISNFFSNAYSTEVPCFEFSDSHYLSKEHKKDESDKKGVFGEKFTWINFDGTFKDLIMPFSDPSSRIVAGSRSSYKNPQLNLDKYISNITFNINGIPQNIKLSPGINSFIGQKGSGKTLLGNIINCDDELKSKYSDFNITDLKFSISNRNEEVDKNNLKTLFISQNYFDAIVNTKTTEQTINKIDFIREKKERFNMQRNEHQAFYIQKMEEIKNNLIRLNGVMKKENFSYSNVDFSATIENEINILNFRFNDTKEIFLNNLNKDLYSVKEIFPLPKLNVNSKINEINEFKVEYENMSTELNSAAQKIIEQNFSEQTLSEINSYKMRELTKKIFDEEIEFLNNSMKNRVNDFNKNVEIIYKLTIAKKMNINYINEIDDFSEKYISSFNNSEFDNKEENFSDQKLGVYIDNYKIQFNLEEDSILNYDSSVFTKKNEILTFLNKNLMKINKNGVRSQYLNWSIDSIIETAITDFTNKCKNKTNFKLDFGEIINGDEKVSYESLSPGRVSTVLWKLILNREIPNENYDLLILDQPEDNLDMETIKTTIIDEIRKIKNNVQIILISHNASVVINSDSDVIVLAKHDERNIIKYDDTLKTYDNNSKALQLLDGGEKFFLTRHKKYYIEGNKSKYENNNQQ